MFGLGKSKSEPPAVELKSIVVLPAGNDVKEPATPVHFHCVFLALGLL